MSAAFTVPPPAFELLCECEQLDCVQRIEVPPDVYERARMVLDRYVIAPGHEVGDDRIVAAERAYTVVVSRPIARPQLRRIA